MKEFPDSTSTMTIMSKRTLGLFTDKTWNTMRGIKTAFIGNTSSVVFSKGGACSSTTKVSKTSVPQVWSKWYSRERSDQSSIRVDNRRDRRGSRKMWEHKVTVKEGQASDARELR